MSGNEGFTAVNPDIVLWFCIIGNRKDRKCLTM